MTGLTIGELGARAGVNIETLRYYERRGLLSPPARTNSNYRAYSDDTVRVVRFIKRAQELGFSLNEIKELLSLRAAPAAQCCDVRERAEQKIREIEQKIRSLQAMREALAVLTSECPGETPITECPILEAIDLEVKA
jgi:MerR family mercuric resistance operon transcriptional regulator